MRSKADVLRTLKAKWGRVLIRVEHGEITNVITVTGTSHESFTDDEVPREIKQLKRYLPMPRKAAFVYFDLNLEQSSVKRGHTSGFGREEEADVSSQFFGKQAKTKVKPARRRIVRGDNNDQKTS